MDTYRNLSKRLKRFVEAIVVEGKTQTEAARIISPAARFHKQLGHKLRHLPKIAKAIEELDAQAMANAGITATRAWTEVRRIAEFDHRKLVDDKGIPVPLEKLDDDTAAGIAGVEVEEIASGRGEERVAIGTLKKYRAWNKVDALKMILQARKELVERHEMTGRDGGPITTRDESPAPSLADFYKTVTRIPVDAPATAAEPAAPAEPTPDAAQEP